LISFPLYKASFWDKSCEFSEEKVGMCYFGRILVVFSTFWLLTKVVLQNLSESPPPKRFFSFVFSSPRKTFEPSPPSRKAFFVTSSFHTKNQVFRVIKVFKPFLIVNWRWWVDLVSCLKQILDKKNGHLSTRASTYHCHKILIFSNILCLFPTMKIISMVIKTYSKIPAVCSQTSIKNRFQKALKITQNTTLKKIQTAKKEFEENREQNLFGNIRRTF
jgi:hypothetical protein